MPDRIAMDIETIPTVENPDFNDASDWLPFAIVLGHQNDSMTDPAVDVLFCDDPSVEFEAQL